jgi:hypothetical protein
MSVNSFDPASLAVHITPDIIRDLVTAAEHLDGVGFGLNPATLTHMPGLCKQGPVDWAAAVGPLADAEIIALIRVFTRGERDLPGWEAGAKSPVVPMVRELKKRGRFDPSLSAWIKANTNNRFLPHGSLMDRL